MVKTVKATVKCRYVTMGEGDRGKEENFNLPSVDNLMWLHLSYNLAALPLKALKG